MARLKRDKNACTREIPSNSTRWKLMTFEEYDELVKVTQYKDHYSAYYTNGIYYDSRDIYSPDEIYRSKVKRGSWVTQVLVFR